MGKALGGASPAYAAGVLIVSCYCEVWFVAMNRGGMSHGYCLCITN